MKDGGPAFPFCTGRRCDDGTVEDWRAYGFGDSGMSLRDWFAGMAIAACQLQVQSDIGEALGAGAHSYWFSSREIAARCFEVADAMIAEREKRNARAE